MALIPQTLRGRATPATAAAAAVGLVFALSLEDGRAAEQIRFGKQAWPGVTVKTEVAVQLLNTLGYPATIKELGPQFVYQGMRGGDVDVTLGAWMPAHKSMLQPLIDDGHAERHAANLRGAIQGLAVPAYVCEDGITEVADLDPNAERFDSKIYAISAGAAMTEAFDKAVKADYKGLGDWQVVPSSTSGMLAQVERKTRNKEAIVFHGWKPHWMAVKFDLCFLEDGEDSEIAAMDSTVWTITRTGWADANPEAAAFLEQFEVEPAVQSRWIYNFSYKERPAEEVAKTWMSNNLGQLKPWLEGVQAADGRSAMDAVRSAYDEN